MSDTDLVLHVGQKATVAEVIHAGAAVRALEGIVKDARKQVDERLRQIIDAESERTGTAFSGKWQGYNVYLTDPQPKPFIEDRDAFIEWCAENDHPLSVEREVKIIEPDRILKALDDLGDGVMVDSPEFESIIKDVITSLKVVEEFYVHEDIIDKSVAAGDWIVVGDGVVTAEGERVGGLGARLASKPTLTVKGDAKAKARVKREVSELIGLEVREVGA